MTDLDSDGVIQQLREGESDRVEFKESLRGDAPNRIREAICALANDLPDHRKPGFVFVGVRDDGTVAGLSVTDELLRQLADMKTDGNIVPPPSLTVERRSVSGNDVAVIAVQPSDSPPVRYDGRVHVRIGSRRGTATAQDERILNEKRRYRDIPFDIQPIPSATLSDLNLPQFEHEYLTQAFSPDILEVNERSTQEQLAATKMTATAEEPLPTVLGILMIGKNPQDFLPGAYVQFLRLNGPDITSEIIDSQEFRGTIPDIVRRLDEKLIAHNRTAVDIISGPVEQRTSLYPNAAIQQITRNAIMHRTYEETNAPVSVYWYNDRLEVMSPGGLFGAVTADNLGSFGIVDYRNPNVADAMKTLGFVQRFGYGIPRARQLLEEAGHPEPEFAFPENHVFVTIRAKSKEERQ